MGFAFFYGKKKKDKKIKRNFKKALEFSKKMCIIMMLPIWHPYAGMAELADALDSGSSESNFMEVQVLLPAPNSRNPNPKGSDFSLLLHQAERRKFYACRSFLMRELNVLALILQMTI